MACLYAACERAGYTLDFSCGPEKDVTLYSLNSITGPSLIPEINAADTITVITVPMHVHLGMN
mgnify:CR=1 FL=1